MTDLVHWLGTVAGGASGLFLLGRGLTAYGARHKEHQTELAKRETVEAQHDASNSAALWRRLEAVEAGQEACRKESSDLRTLVGQLQGQNTAQQTQMGELRTALDTAIRERGAADARSEQLVKEMADLRRAVTSGHSP